MTQDEYRSRAVLKAAFLHDMLSLDYSEKAIREIFESALEDYRKITEVQG